MADALTFAGELRSVPTDSWPASGDPTIDMALAETAALLRKSVASFQLTSDSPAVVAFGPVVNARVVVIKTKGGGPVTALITSGAGVAQAVPVDSLWVCFTAGNPVTAISLVRTPASLTEVRVYLGE